MASTQPVETLPFALPAGGCAVLLFAASRRDPSYQAQVDVLRTRADELATQQTRLAHLFEEGESFVDDEPLDAAAVQTLRRRFDVPKEAFRVVILGPDGGLRKSDDAPLEPQVLLDCAHG